ncbi:MAG: lauroyl acyltransferase [Rhodospirillales bacterium]|nr:lauroyl acyltransferase [Rhodospirillales bacterium]
MLRPRTLIEKYIRHPLEALAATVVWGVFRILPVNLASALGGGFARVVGPRIKISDRARKNIERAFPGIEDEDAEEIIADMWENLGRTVAEFPHISKFGYDGANPRVKVDGLEHLIDFRDDGKPGFYLSAHLANWELAPLTAHVHDVPSAFVYREANNRLVENFYMSGRKLYRDMMIPKGREGARSMLKALKDGKHIGIMLDQKMNDGIPVPFFGIDAMTATALGDLATSLKCPVIPARVIRENGARFRVEVSKPLYAEDTGDKARDSKELTERCNKIIEGWVREKPGQWLWLHNRWPG